MAPRSAVLGKRPRPEPAALMPLAAGAVVADAAPADRVKVTAELIAKVLGLLAANPNSSLRGISNDLGVAYKNMWKHIQPNPRGALKKPEVLMAFADYAHHAASIERSLKQLGHPAPSATAAGEASNRNERQPFTAERIHLGLVNKIATGKHMDSASMDRWARATSWKARNLAKHLAQMPDYPDYRDRIESSLKKLEILGPQEALPEPAKTTRDSSFDAPMLVAALRLTLEREKAKAKNVRNTLLTRPLHEALDIKRSTLNGWIKAGGRLRKPAGSVSRLRGYEAVHGEIRQLLKELGQHDIAAQLPEVAVRRQEMRTEFIARALAMIAEVPTRQLTVIAPQVGIDRTTLTEYLGTDATSLQFDKIAALADYGAHVDSIRDSLQRLGRQDVAAALRAPASQVVLPSTQGVQARIPVQNFMSQAETQLPQVMAVARMMRDNPTVTLETALSLVDVSKPVVRLLLDERGGVRHSRGVLQHFEDADGEALARLSQLLDRIARQLGPATDMPSSNKRPMKALRLRSFFRRPVRTEAAEDRTEEKPGAGTRKRPRGVDAQDKGFFQASDRMLIVDHDTAEPVAGARNQLQRIYAKNASRVHGPRSHAPNRPRQVLRWLSTVLKAQKQFRDGLEIQCCYEPTHGVVVVSSNSLDVNSRLKDFLTSGGLAALLNEQVPTAAAPDGRFVVQAPRKDRHREKLSTRMAPAADPHPTLESDALFAAIAEGRFRVPLSEDDDSKFLHAERRILNYVHEELGAPLNLDLLAGTMRPCGTCANELRTGPGHHRGPFWMSKASRGGLKGHDDIDRQVREGTGTSVTLSRGGRLTFDHDTDSDSDVEPEATTTTVKREPTPDVAALVDAVPSASLPSSSSAVPPRRAGKASREPADVRRTAQGDDDFIAAYLGQTVTGPRQARQMLREQVLAQVSDFNDRAWHRDGAYASVDAVLAGIRADTGMDIARAVRLAQEPGDESLRTSLHARTVGQRNIELQALRDQAVTAHQILVGLGVAVPSDMPESRPQTERILQRLIEEGSRRYADFMSRPDEPTPEERQDLLQIGRQVAMLRRSATRLGWLPQEASPMHPLPAQSRRQSEAWSQSQVRDSFARGSASGVGNNCWFDALAQLSLDQPRGQGTDDDAVERLAGRLRLAADRLGLSRTGEMFDDDNGTMHLIAHALQVQVHVFREQPDGALQLSALQSVGAPRSRPVYIRSDNTHFVPMWPTWHTAPRRFERPRKGYPGV